MVKTHEKFLLQNQKNLKAESWYVRQVLKVYQICSNDDPRMTFDFLMARSNLNLMHKYGETIERSVSQNVL